MEQKTRKKKFGGYPALGVVVSVTLALIVVGIFAVFISYANQFEKKVREDITLKVYLKNSLSETQLRQLQQSIRDKKFVSATDNSIVFVSKDEAEKDLGDVGDFKEILGDNPLKDMLEVRVDPAFHDSTSLNQVKAEVERISGVLEAIYEKDVLDTINKNFRIVSLVLVVIEIFLLIAVVLLINNTLRIALFSQRFLIRSMQLVGARNWFIQRPFLAKAALYGMLSGLIASACLKLFTKYLYQWFENLVLLHDQERFLTILASMVLLGMLIAVVSTYLAIRRYLHMTLDELI